MTQTSLPRTTPKAIAATRGQNDIGALRKGCPNLFQGILDRNSAGLPVVRVAEPHDVQRFRVVGVVCLDVRMAAALARLALKAAASHRRLGFPASADALRVPGLAPGLKGLPPLRVSLLPCRRGHHHAAAAIRLQHSAPTMHTEAEVRAGLLDMALRANLLLLLVRPLHAVPMTVGRVSLCSGRGSNSHGDHSPRGFKSVALDRDFAKSLRRCTRLRLAAQGCAPVVLLLVLLKIRSYSASQVASSFGLCHTPLVPIRTPRPSWPRSASSADRGRCHSRTSRRAGGAGAGR